MKTKKRIMIIVLITVAGLAAAYMLKGMNHCKTITRKCSHRGEGGHCVGDKFFAYSGIDTSCTQTPYRCDRGTCCKSCVPPACPESDQSRDVDKDGYTDQCSDCASRAEQTPGGRPELVHPGNSNPYCDCDPKTPPEHPSSVGISELTGCHLDASGKHFKPGCLCEDGMDNDCDGLVDSQDPDCPRLGKDMVVDGDMDFTESKDISPEGVYVLSGTLLIKKGVTLTVGKDRGIHVGPEGKIKVEENAFLKTK